MTTSYPSGLDSFTNPSGTDETDDEIGTRTHSEFHADTNDAIEAIEGELGVNPSGTAATVKARIEAVEAARLDYRLTDYGTVDLTGSTDATSVLNAALTAMYAAGGGTLVFPEGTILIAGQIVLPSGNATATGATKQPPMIWRGQGAHASGQNEDGTGGTRLLCTYDGATYNAAKFVTRGLGNWAIEDITFYDTTANADTPFLYTTNTTLRVNRCAFIGATSGTSCQQDAIVLGGTLKPISTGYGDADSAFQGYGTVISDCYFNKVRRVVYGRSYCNHVQVIHNYADKYTGTNLASGAVIEFDGSLDPVTANVGDYCTNNLILGNYLHAIGGYAYGVKITKGSRNSIIANGFIDEGSADVAVCRFNGVTVGATDYPSTTNLMMGNASQLDVHLSEDTMSTGRNYLLNPSYTEAVVFGPRMKMPGDAQLIVDTPTVGVAAWTLKDAATEFLKLTYAAGGTWDVGAPVNLIGNAVTPAGSTYLTIGNNSRASDAVVLLKAPTGNANQIQYYRNNVHSWRLYDANSALLFLRDEVNGVMAFTFNPGNAAAGRIDVGWRLRVPAARGIEYDSGGPVDLAGSGTPEAAITAPIGSTYRRSDGGAATSLYIKESGTGNTGWVASGRAASETVTGAVELATSAEVITGTDTTRAVTPAGWTAGAGAYERALMPTGAKAETISRFVGSVTNLGAVATSGTLFLVACPLRAGVTVSSITFVSRTTALVAGTNQWFGLFSDALVPLRLTADDTSTAWAASTAKTLTLTSPFVTTYSGLYYLGVCVVAGTVPSLIGAQATTSLLAGIAPKPNGTSTTGLTDPASCPNPVAALTQTVSTPYAYIS